MITREIRPKDLPQVLAFLREDFPEEEALLGMRPQEVEQIVHRIFRWDTRLVLGMLRLVGRPVFHFYVIEEGGHLIATTQLSFAERSGYISMVVVDRAHRRQGLARELLERARRATRRRGKPYLVLDVLAANTPARTLYERIGYRLLRANAYFMHERPSELLPAPSRAPGLRPFAPADARGLVEVARRDRPAEVERVVPYSSRQFLGSAWVGRVLGSRSAAWVLDDGSGPMAWVSATASRATEAAHLSTPVIDASIAPDRAAALVRVGGAWCAEGGAPRIVVQVPAENARARAALEATGFREAIPTLTLYRPVD